MNEMTTYIFGSSGRHAGLFPDASLHTILFRVKDLAKPKAANPSHPFTSFDYGRTARNRRHEPLESLVPKLVQS